MYCSTSTGRKRLKPMDNQDLERLAFDGSKLPTELGAEDSLYFLMLRALYSHAKLTNMDPEQGRQEKARIAEVVRKFRLDMESARSTMRKLSCAGTALPGYRKARNEMQELTAYYLPAEVVAVIAAGDKIVEVLDGIPIEKPPAKCGR